MRGRQVTYWGGVRQRLSGLAFMLSVALVSLNPSRVLAQAPSPFDLIPRLDEAAQKVALGIVDTVTMADAGLAVPTANPFDIIRDGGRQPTVQRIDPIVAAGLERVPGTAVGAARSTFDTLLIFVLLLLLSITYLLQGGALRRMFGAAFNQNSLSRLMREQQRGNFLLWGFLGALIVASLAYVTARELRPGWLATRWTALDGFIVAVLGLSLGKLGALQILKAAFPLDKPVSRYQMLILIWLGILGVVGFPLLVLVSLGPAPVAHVVAWGVGPLIVVALLLRSISAFASAGGVATKYPAHFLLYLCALEIGPLIVMVTWLARRVAPG